MPTSEEASDDGPVCRLQTIGRDIMTLSEDSFFALWFTPELRANIKPLPPHETKAASCEDTVTPTVLNVILPDGGSLISCGRLCFRRVDAALRTRTARSVFLVEAEAESTRRAIFL